MTRHVMTAWTFGSIVVNICKLEKGSLGYKFCTESIEYAKSGAVVQSRDFGSHCVLIVC